MIQNIELTAGPAAAASGSCTCCTPTSEAVSGEAVSDEAVSSGVRSSYGVAGTTCDHCVAAVREQISALPGVSAVKVNLVAGATSTLTLTTTVRLNEAVVAAALDEAGYVLAPLPR